VGSDRIHRKEILQSPGYSIAVPDPVDLAIDFAHLVVMKNLISWNYYIWM
jgi:hypothetical protein